MRMNWLLNVKDVPRFKELSWRGYLSYSSWDFSLLKRLYTSDLLKRKLPNQIISLTEYCVRNFGQFCSPGGCWRVSDENIARYSCQWTWISYVKNMRTYIAHKLNLMSEKELSQVRVGV